VADTSVGWSGFDDSAAAGLLSSFGYLFTGTSLQNVAPSHPARMTDEPLTKRRVFINWYGSINHSCALFLAAFGMNSNRNYAALGAAIRRSFKWGLSASRSPASIDVTGAMTDRP
jgi:hypothetical protein